MLNLLFRTKDAIIFFSRGPSRMNSRMNINIAAIKADIDRNCNPEIK